MADKEQDSRTTADDPLELNKEILQDLDLEPADPENVKGGGTVTSVYPRATGPTRTINPGSTA